MASAHNRHTDPPRQDVLARPTPASLHVALNQRDFELEFLAGVLERNPYYLDVLTAHAHNLAARRRYHHALTCDRRIVRLRPDWPIGWYNLACDYAMLGRIDQAFQSLGEALERGYRHLNYLQRDPDLKPLHQDPRFRRLVLRYS